MNCYEFTVKCVEEAKTMDEPKLAMLFPIAINLAVIADKMKEISVELERILKLYGLRKL